MIRMIKKVLIMTIDMKKGFALAFTVLLVFSGIILLNNWTCGIASGATYYGEIDGDDVHWISGDNPHIVDTVINITGNLTIEAGAVVKVNGNAGKIIVKAGGKLSVEGSQGNLVYINGNSTTPSPGDWYGIVVEDTGTAFINHTMIGNATKAIYAPNNFTGRIEIDSCVINETSEWGIYCDPAGDTGTLVVNKTRINNTGTPGEAEGGLRLTIIGDIEECNISNSGGDGIFIAGGDLSHSPTINNTLIFNSTASGINISGGDAVPRISNCNISEIWENNIYITGNSRNIVLDNCTIKNWSDPGNAITVKIANTDATHRINISLLNSSYTNETFSLSEYGNLSIDYLVRVTVEDGNGAGVGGATVKMINRTSMERGTNSTDPSGKTWSQGTHFIYNATGFWYDQYYEINVTCPGFSVNDQSVQMDQYRTAAFTMTDTAAPVFGTVSNGPLTTGENTWFSANITDNVGVNSVKFVYLVNGAILENVSVTNNTGDDWLITVLIPADTTSFTFYFWADDAAGNGKKSANQTPAATDNDKPVFGTVTPGTLTTGELAWFSANITDNVGINSVKFVYLVNGAVLENVSVTNNTGDDWLITVLIPSDTTSFTFYFWVDDGAANEKKSANQTPAVADNDKPVFGTVTPGTLTTGELAWFSANITDNIGVNSVKFVYLVNGTILENVSVTNNTGDDWLITVLVPSDTTSFTFYFWADDAAGNEKKSANQTPAATDNDKPVFGTVTPGTLTTGELAWFSANITDNIDVNSPKFVYLVNGAILENVSVTNNTGDDWLITVLIPSDTTSFTFYFWADDAAGNEKKSANQTPAAADNDKPVFGTVTPGTLTTGELAWFSANITDNVGVNAVKFVYLVNGAILENVSVTNNTGNDWLITVLIPSDATSFTFYFWADDAAGNEKKSANQTPVATDNDKPIFGAVSNGTLTTGELAWFSANITDNVGVNSVKFVYLVNAAILENVSVTNNTGDDWLIAVLIPSSTSSFTFYFWTDDAAANEKKSANQTLAPVDNDKPLFGTVSPGTLTTGENAWFSANITDNVGMNSVKFIYLVNGAILENVSVTNNTDDDWLITVVIPSDTTGFTFYFWADDSAGNEKKSANQTPAVSDNDAPTSAVDTVSPYWSNSGPIAITVTAADNVGLSNVTLWYRYSADNLSWGSWIHFANDPAAPWSFNFLTSNGSGYYEFYSIANDTGGNTEGIPGSNDTICAHDSISPTASAGGDQTVGQGTMITFNSTVSSDNLMLANYTWTFNDGGVQTLYGASPAYTFNNVGNFMVTLNITDAAGNWDNDTVNITVADTEDPNVNAGQDQTVNQGDNVVFDGSGSTDNIGIDNYTWSFIYDSYTIYLFDASPTFTFQIAGVYTVTLTVTDAAGNSDTDTMIVTVSDANLPVADAGEDQTVAQHTQVFFNGSGSTDNVGIDNYTWTFNDSGLRVLYGVSPNYTFSNAGIFDITLNVTDVSGFHHTDVMVLTVTDISQPTANAGPDQIVDQYEPVTFDGTGSMDNMAIDTYTWTFQYTGIPVYLFGTNPNWTFEIVGIYTITLTVVDDEGNSGTDTMTVTVTDITDPGAEAGADLVVDQGTKVIFNGSGCTDNVGINNYTWSFNDSGMKILYGLNPNYTFNNAGIFTVTLNVTDVAGNWDIDIFVITVKDTTVPMADAGTALTVDQGVAVNFDGSGSSDNVGIANYTWTLNDGVVHTLYGETTVFTFMAAGTYTVTLTVTDAAGNTGTDTVVVTVGDTMSPVAEAGDNQTIIQNTQYIFNGSLCTDNVRVMNYTWTFTDGVNRTLYGLSPNHTFENEGTYVIFLNVSDAAGNWAMDNMTVTVTKEAAGPFGSITGKVTFSDENPDNVKATVTVSMNGMVVKTIMDNVFVFEDLSYGTYLVKVEATGYHGYDYTLIVYGDETLDFHLSEKVIIKENTTEKIEHRNEEKTVVVEIIIRGNGTLNIDELDRNETIQMAEETPAGYDDIGIFMEIKFNGTLDWIIIEVPYDENALPDGVEESSLRLYFWNEVAAQWEVIPGSEVDVDANVVRANVTHLTIFAPMAEQKEVSGEESNTTYLVVIFAVVMGVLLLLLVIFISKSGKGDEEKEEEDKEREEFEEEEEDEEMALEEEEMGDDGEYECPDCGAVLGEGDEKCPECGAEFDDEEENEDEEEDEEEYDDVEKSGKEEEEEDDEEEGRKSRADRRKSRREKRKASLVEDEEEGEVDVFDEEEGDEDEDEGDWGEEPAEEEDREEEEEADEDEDEGDWGDETTEKEDLEEEEETEEGAEEGDWEDEVKEEDDEGEWDDESSDEGSWEEEEGTEDVVEEEAGEGDWDDESSDEGDWDDEEETEDAEDDEGDWEDADLEIFED